MTHIVSRVMLWYFELHGGFERQEPRTLSNSWKRRCIWLGHRRRWWASTRWFWSPSAAWGLRRTTTPSSSTRRARRRLVALVLASNVRANQQEVATRREAHTKHCIGYGACGILWHFLNDTCYESSWQVLSWKVECWMNPMPIIETIFRYMLHPNMLVMEYWDGWLKFGWKIT